MSKVYPSRNTRRSFSEHDNDGERLIKSNSIRKRRMSSSHETRSTITGISGGSGGSGSTYASSVTATTTMGGRIQNAFFEFVYDQVERQSFGKILSPILEIVFLFTILFSLIPNYHGFLTDLEETNESENEDFEWFLMVIQPSHLFEKSSVAFLIMFFIFVAFITVVFSIIIFKILFPEKFSFLSILIPIMVRTVRITSCYFISLFSSPLSCSFFDGSFDWSPITSNCFEIPGVFYLILGVIMIIITILISSLDLLFYLEKFRNIRRFTACSNGRFMFFFAFIVYFHISISPIYHQHIISNVIGQLIFCSLLLFLCFANVRICPYYNKIYQMIFTILLSVVTGVQVHSLFDSILGNAYSLLSLISIIVLVITFVCCMIFKYVLVFKFSNSNYKRNIWMNWTAHDLVLNVFLTEKKEHYNEKIGNLVEDTSTNKSASTLLYLITLLISTDNVLLANLILKHVVTLCNSTRVMLDTKFEMHRWKEKISELQYAGNSSKLKLAQKMKKISKMEEKLDNLMKSIFSELLEEKINYGRFPRMISDFQYLKENIHSKYLGLMNTQISEKVFYKFSNFLRRYCNYQRDALEFENKGKMFEETSGKITQKRKSRKSSFNKGKILSPVPIPGSNLTEENMETVTNPAITDITKGCLSVRSGLSRAKRTKKGDELNENEVLNNRVQKTRFYSVISMYFMLWCVLLSILSVILLLFVIYTLMITNFNRMGILIDHATHLRTNAVSAALFSRKLQISFLPDELVPIIHERNSSHFRKELTSACSNLRKYARLLHQTCTKKEVWNSFVVPYKILKTGKSFIEKAPVLDVMILYADKCEDFLVKTDQDLRNLTHSNALLKLPAFYFLMLNEYAVTHTLEDIVGGLISAETEIDVFYMYTCVIVPFSIPIFIIFFIFLHFFVVCEQKNSLKGFRLIPKEFLVEKYSDMGGMGGEESAKIQISPITIATRSLISIVIAILVCVGVLSFFSVYSYLLRTQSDVRNAEYDTANRLVVFIRRIHYRMSDILYPEQSLFTNEQIIFELKDHYNDIGEVSQLLRFGDGGSLPGFDNGDRLGLPSNVFYKDYCVVTVDEKTSLEPFDVMRCMSINRQILHTMEIAESLTKMVEYNETYINPDALAEARKSEFYYHIIEMDINEKKVGAKDENFGVFLSLIEKSVDIYKDIATSASVMLLVFLAPACIIVFFYFVLTIPQQINRYLLGVKQLVMTFPRELLTTKGVYGYLVGQNTVRVSILDKKKTQEGEFFDILKGSNFSVCLFDKKLRIFYFNDNASETFSLLSSQDEDLSKIFTEHSVEKIMKWMKRGKKKGSFNTELVGIRNDEEITVQADLTRLSFGNKKVFCIIVENVESSNKKAILLKNILPAQLAEKINLEDISSKSGIVDIHKQCTACFIDIANFTGMSKALNPQELIRLLSDIFAAWDNIITDSQLKIEKIKKMLYIVEHFGVKKKLEPVEKEEKTEELKKQDVKEEKIDINENE